VSEITQIEALLRVFHAKRALLRGYIFSATRDYHATEDILQEIAIVIATRASSFDFEREALPWLMGIARNHIQRWYRARGKEAAYVSYDILETCMPLFASYDMEEMSDRRRALKECVERLPEKQRDIMRLRYVEEKDCNQISEVLGRSVQGVYSLLKRLKLALRKCVEVRMQQPEAL
jgi:RNA polymerase sigma-70 factor (ECF subfamily)